MRLFTNDIIGKEDDMLMLIREGQSDKLALSRKRGTAGGSRLQVGHQWSRGEYRLKAGAGVAMIMMSR